jgi:hypothetical protein
LGTDCSIPALLALGGKLVVYFSDALLFDEHLCNTLRHLHVLFIVLLLSCMLNPDLMAVRKELLKRNLTPVQGVLGDHLLQNARVVRLLLYK